MNKLRFTLIFIPMIFFHAGCSASTSSRYEEKNGNEDNKKVTVVEDFDISQYKTQIEIETMSSNQGFSDVWYGYEDSTGESNFAQNLKIIRTVDGFRVLVLSTDNMDKANSVRANILAKIKRKEVYISFEPPFYKVKIGDFTDLTECNNLKFKLNQFGYTEARVVQETVNIFEE
jgi:hypothetical protein